MILTCKEATRLVSQGLDRPLGFVERLRLRLHLAMCDGCRNFKVQMRVLRKAAQRIGSKYFSGDQRT
jgi:predicted anti-sigma-YlaC factor YlaD